MIVRAERVQLDIWGICEAGDGLRPTRPAASGAVRGGVYEGGAGLRDAPGSLHVRGDAFGSKECLKVEQLRGVSVVPELQQEQHAIHSL